MTESELERMIDRRVQRLLSTDRVYQNAENAEQQSAREHEITAAVVREFEAGVQRRLAGFRA